MVSFSLRDRGFEWNVFSSYVQISSTVQASEARFIYLWENHE